MKKLGEVWFEAGAELKLAAGFTNRKFELAKNTGQRLVEIMTGKSGAFKSVFLTYGRD